MSYKAKIQMIFAFYFIYMALGCRTTEKASATSSKSQPKIVLTSYDERTLSPPQAMTAPKRPEGKILSKEEQEKVDLNHLLMLAKHHLTLRQLDTSEGFAKKALLSDFRNPEAKLILAQIAFLKGKFESSKVILSALQTGKYTSPDMENLRALVLLREGDIKGAKVVLEKSVSVNGDNIASRMNLGIIFLQILEPRQAQIQFEEALKIVPDHADIQMHLAISYAMQDKFEKAQFIYDELEKKGIQKAILTFNDAMLKRRKGDLKGALADLETYRSTPDHHKINPEVLQALMDDFQHRALNHAH